MTDAIESWSPSLHDAELLALSSDRSARTVKLRVQIAHLADKAAQSEVFLLVLQSVRALNVTQWQPWEFADRPASDPELMGRRDSGRMSSVEAIDLAGPNLRIHDASVRTIIASDLAWPALTCPPETVVQLLALDVDGAGPGVGDISLAIVFERLQVFRGERTITIEEFVSLGNAYWEEWQRSQGQPKT